MKPLKFQPLLKSTIWGGSKIITFKHLDVKQENVGESWEISGVPGNESIVADGEMQGKSLNEVVAELKGSFLGEENYKRFGNEFPLLIKFIDANRDLSIRCILMMKLPRSKVRNAARPRCGMRCHASRMPSSTTA